MTSESRITAAPDIRVRLSHTWVVSATERAAIRRLLDLAFDGDFDDTDFDHALGGLHVIVTADDDARAIVGHASVVARQMLIGDEPRRCGYVEAVAVDTAYQRRGIGGRLMSTVEQIVDGAYDLGALGASDAGRPLYLAHGWMSWRGPLGVLAPDGLRLTPDDRGAVLVRGADLDLEARLACDWRAGDVW